MAISDFDAVLRAKGFTRIGDEMLPEVTLPLSRVSRAPVLTARKHLHGASLDVQLQRASSANSGGWLLVARLEHPSIRGEGMLRPRLWWGLWRMLASGPKIAVAILAALMCTGVIVVFLPGVLLMWLVRRTMLTRRGLSSWSDVVIPDASRRYLAWGTEREAARAALPPALQTALIAAGWFGQCEVRGGQILLEAPAGFGRVDLLRALVDAAERVAATLDAR